MSARRPRVPRFLRTLLIVTAVVQIAPALAFAELARSALVGLVAWAFGMAAFVHVAREALMDTRRSPWVVRLVDVPIWIHWCASIAATLILPLGAIVLAALGALDRSWLLRAYELALALAFYGVVVRRAWFVTKRITVEIPRLPRELDGLRVAHLSDLHIGTHAPRAWGERWVRAANAAGADLAVVTGDLVTSGTQFHAEIAAIIGQLRAPLGVFVSMGNHDYFGEGEPLITLMRAEGATVLRNEGRVLEKGGAKMFLAAIDDTWTRRADLERALADRPEAMFTVLLAHDPEQFPRAASAGADLVLSGHTHGGQVALPFFARHASLSRLAHRFNLGLYELGASALYVHPGLGVTGPPVRLGVAPAVVILTLRCAENRAAP